MLVNMTILTMLNLIKRILALPGTMIIFLQQKIMVDNIFICLSDGNALNDNYSFTGYTTSRTEELLPIYSKYSNQ